MSPKDKLIKYRHLFRDEWFVSYGCPHFVNEVPSRTANLGLLSYSHSDWILKQKMKHRCIAACGPSQEQHECLSEQLPEAREDHSRLGSSAQTPASAVFTATPWHYLYNYILRRPLIQLRATPKVNPTEAGTGICKIVRYYWRRASAPEQLRHRDMRFYVVSGIHTLAMGALNREQQIMSKA